MCYLFSIHQKYILILLTLSLFQFAPAEALEDVTNPIEAGNVKWMRDLDDSLLLSKQSGKPILVLFQEIPGCLGCQKFGNEVLTHPLLVEAIETEFHPVLVYNNRPGTQDERWLQQYKEPSWNFQVIRFLDSRGFDIIPRKDKIWTISALAARIITALHSAGREIPWYLKAVAMESDADHLGQVAFAMSCFWTGEYLLGKINGVVTTEAGWYDNREVTLVTYNNTTITLDTLVSKAKKERCAQTVYLPPGEEIVDNGFKVDIFNLSDYHSASFKDQKKQLERWQSIQNVPNLTPMQLTKINATAPDHKKDALKWLSPRQVSALESMQ